MQSCNPIVEKAYYSKILGDFGGTFWETEENNYIEDKVHPNNTVWNHQERVNHRTDLHVLPRQTVIPRTDSMGAKSSFRG
mmetsp:Transcript_9377/g.14476  ORF Transcript_9377/g.14476 Transcript_9377/m.14476 type:complete len:80 (+) Transcript_9377:1065-1304(+)